MNIIFQAALFFGICLVGNCISTFLPFPFPGSVLAMIILFILLVTKCVKTEKINEMSDFLLENMTFFFIPPTVGVINYLDLIQNVWWQFFLICCLTTALTFFATAYTVKGVMYLINKGGKKDE